ncbi:MAG: hypothetical protein JWO50_83 [Candidatus Kaiserbacteria bacterium]|nr:hypothetical protein [Candidatus Kaiserbacteria bacterium]
MFWSRVLVAPKHGICFRKHCIFLLKNQSLSGRRLPRGSKTYSVLLTKARMSFLKAPRSAAAREEQFASKQICVFLKRTSERLLLTAHQRIADFTQKLHILRRSLRSNFFISLRERNKFIHWEHHKKVNGSSNQQKRNDCVN